LNFFPLDAVPALLHPQIMLKKKATPKPKRNPASRSKRKAKRQAKEDFNQAVYRTVQETIRRSEQ
jgi:hypothetical protein